MQFPLRLNISLMGFFSGCECAEINGRVIYSNVSLPFPIAAVSRNSKQPTFGSALLGSTILRVSCSSSWSQVFKSVIIANPIDMIHRAIVKLTGHINPCHSVSLPCATFEPERQITAMVPRACDVPDMNALSDSFLPSENSRFRIIMKHFSDLFGGNVINHNRCPIDTWFLTLETKDG